MWDGAARGETILSDETRREPEGSHEPVSEFRQRIRYYADILNPLFWHDSFYNADVLFEYVCTLVRAGGIQDAGWDAFEESEAVLQDLKGLGELELPTELFPDINRTRARLALISYCHLTEMDLPYRLLANLLRVRIGQKYDIAPFRHLYRPISRKGLVQKFRLPSPTRKIAEIKKLAEAAKLPALSGALDEIYDNIIRNAVYHSDYVLHNGEMRLLSDYWHSKQKKHYTQVIESPELVFLINNAFAFFSALLSLYNRARTLLKDFKDTFLPFDSYYKGLLEFVYEDTDTLIGFRAYWPNGTLSQFTRTRNGCVGTNISFDPDRSINFFVGLYASKPGKFSPLVEDGAAPVYPPRPGSDIRPYWPDELKSYKLPATPTPA